MNDDSTTKCTYHLKCEIHQAPDSIIVFRFDVANNETPVQSNPHNAHGIGHSVIIQVRLDFQEKENFGTGRH